MSHLISKSVFPAEKADALSPCFSFHTVNLCPFLFKINVFIYLFILAALGLCCCAWAFSGCGERGLLFVVVRRLLVVVASLVVEHGL